MAAVQPAEKQHQTLDLPAIAHVRKGEAVRVQQLPDAIDDLYEKTVQMLPVREQREAERRDADGSPDAPERRKPGSRRAPSRVVPPPSAHLSEEFIPNNDDLRQRFLLAEAVGGYEALHDLLNVYSPGLTLARKYARKVKDAALTEPEVSALEAYQAQIRLAMERANHYLATHSLERFSREEIHELHDLLTMAARRDKELTRILGAHLIHEVERAVERLNELTIKIHSVEHSVNGVFLVNSEVMFIPTNELINTVNTVFRAVGNPYLASNIDGVLLLAARNLLIQVVAFFSYYGKHQIYNLFQKGGSSTSISAVTFRIRSEIRKLFAACKKDNKLVLTRVMADTEREFDLSVEAIQREAEKDAVNTVRRIIPQEPVKVEVKRGWLSRVFGLFR